MRQRSVRRNEARAAGTLNKWRDLPREQIKHRIQVGVKDGKAVYEFRVQERVRDMQEMESRA